MERYEYPFSALVRQGKPKAALLFDLVEPRLGGVLIRGEKGAARSTTVHGLTELMDEVEVAGGCLFRCRMDGRVLCDECRSSPTRRAIPYHRRAVELPVSATEGRMVGALDLERALKRDVRTFETGLLAQANGNILYVDEINLLEDHIADVLLDSATMRTGTVEREGISYSHPARLILMGTISPEEGDLQSQLLDHFDLMMGVHGEQEAKARKKVVRRRLAFEENPAALYARWAPGQGALRRRIGSAQALLPQVSLPEPLLDTVTRVRTTLQVDGHRAGITMPKTARALATLEGRTEAGMEELRRAAELALPHRLCQTPFKQAGDANIDWEALFYR